MRHRQHGTFIVEFAIIAAVMFIILFAVIELFRLMWVWNTVDEATRRGARVAAVCPIGDDDIKRATVFASYNPATNKYSGNNNSSILRDLDVGDVTVKYLAEDGTELGTPYFETVKYVSVAINHKEKPFIPFFDFGTDGITLPTFETTLPAESLGYVPQDDPDNAYCSCFGKAGTLSSCKPRP